MEKIWSTSEHYFQAQKFHNSKYEEIIRSLDSPMEAAVMGRDDSFGDDYTVVKREDDGDIVRVQCSRYGIVNWAIQYGDYVEIINPQPVIDEIKKRIETLKDKYFKEEN